MFYVYMYLDPLYPANYSVNEKEYKYTPIYIGKGKWRNQRHNDHLKNCRNKIFENKINYWKKNNIDPIVIIINDNMTEIDAWELEVKLIKSIGRFDLGKGPLLNLTNGGEGPAGRIPWNKGKKTGSFLSETGRKIISDANKHPKNHGKKISAALKGKQKSDEHKQKLSKSLQGNIPWNKGKSGLQEAWNKAKVLSDEHKQKLSEAHKGRPNTPEQKEKISKKLKGRVVSDETRRKMSESRKRLWAERKNNDN